MRCLAVMLLCAMCAASSPRVTFVPEARAQQFVACAPAPICGDLDALGRVILPPCAETVTPVAKWDHDLLGPLRSFVVRARLEGDAAWPSAFEVPYVPATSDAEQSAPGVLMPWPVQRVIPIDVFNKVVEYKVVAVSNDGHETPASNVDKLCPPEIKVLR